MSGADRKAGLEAGALALSGQLGRTVHRLRKMHNLSLSELADRSGVAKSIISQIERNETNPTLATIWRLSHAFDVTIEQVLAGISDEPFLEKTTRIDTPVVISEDGLCRLTIIGWLKTVDWLQWYDFQAEPGGVLASEAHQRGSIECLSILKGEVEVEAGDAVETAGAGETLRYRCDRSHIIRAVGPSPVHATMVCILKGAALEET